MCLSLDANLIENLVKGSSEMMLAYELLHHGSLDRLLFGSPDGRWDLVHMSTSAPFTFRILNFLKSRTYMFLKIMALDIKIDMYKRSVCEKVSLKICCILKDKKDKFLIVNSSKVVVK
jgi:hypothetical protein